MGINNVRGVMPMTKANDMSVQLLMTSDNPENVLKSMQPFLNLMMNYECALMEIETKLKILNNEFALQHNRNPFESIKCRLKKGNARNTHAPPKVLEQQD